MSIHAVIRCKCVVKEWKNEIKKGVAVWQRLPFFEDKA
jgi:hypothetical protein